LIDSLANDLSGEDGFFDGISESRGIVIIDVLLTTNLASLEKLIPCIPASIDRNVFEIVSIAQR